MFAVCGFCRSTLAREGDTLRRLGQSAELFDDHTPLQLGVRGVWQKEHFSLVGRLQYRYRDGTWNEWHALFDTGRSAWLSEDNGRYVLVFPAPGMAPLPDPTTLPVESRVMVGGQAWLVASVQRVSLLAAQGELPRLPVAHTPDFVIAELRSTDGDVLSIDYSHPGEPDVTVGKAVRLAELSLTGLVATADGVEGGAAEKTLRAKGLACPQCGAGLNVQLNTTQSVVCGQCRAVVSLAEVTGGALSYYAQASAGDPQIPLGKVGLLALGSSAPLPWQVVGYAERVTQDDDESQWSEYLLYNRSEGFAFLIDAEDGWSWVAPLTGVPGGSGERVSVDGVSYQRRFSYDAAIKCVLGEFYWQLERGQITHNTDFAGLKEHRHRRLSRELTGDASEVVWSAGATLEVAQVAQAFGVELASLPQAESSGGLGKMGRVIFWVIIILLILWLLSRCSVYLPWGGYSSGGSSSGGSYGGYSSGGSHK